MNTTDCGGLSRCTCVRVTPRKKLVERAEYGETQPDPESRNLRGRRYRQSDEAASSPPRHTISKATCCGVRAGCSRSIATRSIGAGSTVLEKETYSSETAYDALNRPVALTAPDGSVVTPGYNAANLVETMQVSLKGQTGSTAFVTNIDYNAKGQRDLIEYGNGVRSTASYDPADFSV
jgi:YD repeat-containing protein